jgi:hypothetical protein
MRRAAGVVVRRTPSDIATRLVTVGILGACAYAVIFVAYGVAEWLRNYR